MANDREVLREIWDGKLPICFQLAQEEIMEIQQPDAFYVMVPRLSYFPLVTDKMKRHFLRYISQENSDSEMWLDYNGQPLKWHYPIGFLYDLYCDKFDQFWAINRRLMESHGDSEGFKHIPIKLYSDDGTCSQRLVSPKNNDGSRKTLQQMIAELYPDKLDVQLRTHGIVIPSDTPLQWLSEHLSYPDNFLHMCVF
ncbi:hypothetical protein HF086_010066 [Spodoptera exigua]|uniref:Autophagy protein 5 n=1 Tax=Spodoptera exigua TaxID=7107 RepID=A0A922MZQ6_SPOEX|nr:hypothetical protein HF086_010066 [Spodoptera exigua]